MKIYLLLSAFALVGSCATTKYSTKVENLKTSIQVNDSTIINKYANTITSNQLKTNLFVFASDSMQGRRVGEEGQKKATQFLQDFYIAEGIKPAINDSTYFQTIPKEFLPTEYNTSENVIAYIKGSEKPEEVVIISGHLDHLGIEDDSIFFGADDNGSGTVAILEIAKAFKLAKDEGFGPKRSILFLHLTAEEIGLYGSRYYIENPAFPLDQTIATLNIDMIGRVDERHKDQPNYVYIIGADRLSKELHYINEKTNAITSNLKLDYRYNDENDNNRYYYRSDHYNFALKNIPVIFYFNGEHEDYHKATDTPEKINYEVLKKRTQLIFSTAWYLANKDNKLLMNTQLQQSE
ncbi:M28 family metallopeptidase [Lacinutrix salivirga]